MLRYTSHPLVNVSIKQNNIRDTENTFSLAASLASRSISEQLATAVSIKRPSGNYIRSTIMDNGFYATVIADSKAHAGVTVVEDNKVRGGDAHYLYSGTIQADGNDEIV